MSISLIVYGYNEIENVDYFFKKAIRFCKKISKKFEIVYLDDDSSDGTLEKVESYKKEINLRIFKNETNRGVGFNFSKILNLAKNEIIIHQTMDWAYDIDSFIPFIVHLKKNKCDVLHGYRKNLFKNRSDNFYRNFVSSVNQTLIRILYGNFSRDFQNVYVIKKKCLKNIRLSSNSSFVNPELLINLIEKGYKIFEVEVNFFKRKYGEAKGAKIISILRSVKDIFIFWTHRGIKFRLMNKTKLMDIKHVLINS